jgi:hypothetical protein
MTRSLRALACVAMLSLASCWWQPEVSNTGYVGTWVRGNAHTRSSLAIMKEGETYRVRWTLKTDDGKWNVTCDWNGRCEEYKVGKKVATFTFQPYVENGLLMLRTTRMPLLPGDPQKYSDLDQLVVEPSGTTLWSYTVERNGTKYKPREGPYRWLKKVSNDIEGRPAAQARNGS